MNEMIERVARAIADNLYSADPYDEMVKDRRANYRIQSVARAAIAAMREPTEAMSQAGGGEQGDPFMANVVWRRMIDEAKR
jgi:hypothetical protein